MAARSASGVKLPPVSHSNAASQAGFTMIPNVVLLHPELSPTAKLIYGYFKHLAWRSTDLTPPRDIIANDLGLSENTVTKAIGELQQTPAAEGDPDSPGLVTVIRRGQGRTNTYIVNDPSLKGWESGNADSAFLGEHGSLLPARVRDDGGSSIARAREKNERQDNARAEPPPIERNADNRNVPLDTLCRVTGVDERSPRFQQALRALNGRVEKLSGKLKEPGIRHLFWIECVRWAEEHDALDRLDLAYDEPLEWAQALSRRIEEKAERYAVVYDGAALSPRALCNHWLDLDLARERHGGGMTADEIERYEL